MRILKFLPFLIQKPIKKPANVTLTGFELTIGVGVIVKFLTHLLPESLQPKLRSETDEEQLCIIFNQTVIG